MEVKSTGILRLLPAREIKVEMKVLNDEISVRSLGESKSYRFDKIFTKSQSNTSIWDYLTRGKSSAVSTLLSGHNVSITTYGEVNSGKTYSFFGQEQSKDLFSETLSEIFSSQSTPLGLSIWEIVYSLDDRCEKIMDLLKISDFKPLPSTLTQDFITVEISSLQEGQYIFECAKELSSNWKTKSEGGSRNLNNRSHFFIRISFENYYLHIIDLSGVLPSNLTPEIRVKLGCDEQLNFTRIGLNQYRSIIWEMAKNPCVSSDLLTTSRKSKLALVISSILMLGKNYFFTAVKEDSEYEDVIKNLDILQRAQGIKIRPEVSFIEKKIIPMSVFIQRHKVAKYWEFNVKHEKVDKKSEFENSGKIDKEIGSFEKEDEKQEPKEFSRNLLKEQISQMLQELDEGPSKKSEFMPETVIVNNNVSFENPCSKAETSFFKEKNALIEAEIAEIKATHELEIDNLRLENCSLRQKLRTVQDETNFVNIFKIYEDEISKLESNIKSLREDFITSLHSIEKSIEIVDNEDHDDINILKKKYKSSIKELANSMKQLQQNILEKEKESSNLKKNERKWHMSRKCFENIARKSVALESVVGKQSKNLQLNETTFHEMIEEIERLNSENGKLKKKCTEADEYSTRITEELKIMKDIAATSGMPEETLNRIHKNLQAPFKVQSDFVISLIHRLQNELNNKKHINFLDNIAHEVEILANAFEESQVREKNMFEILLEMQKRLDKTDGEFSKETNKLLRQTLLSQLTL
ncbi:hypothetical protein SteCoe_9687 [Stentor coeruleus]|uniref:Kinesin motor domain-containing protein n=1 Tax=Stentor coeruleus TaxID=5963 RepID=A0A1R2CH93_9CILI|nr:hypothetical protein SteCoe_9687 [Stentor coeruleus]